MSIGPIDGGLADRDNLSPPDVIVREIVDNLEAALEQFRLIANETGDPLEGGPPVSFLRAAARVLQDCATSAKSKLTHRGGVRMTPLYLESASHLDGLFQV